MSARHDEDLATEVLESYSDPATDRFDAVLAAAAVDEATARELRYWQRESVRGLRQYAAQALPGVLAAVDDARREAAAAAARAEDTWRQAQRPSVAAEADVFSLPELSPAASGDGGVDLLEMRRRTVAARLAQIA